MKKDLPEDVTVEMVYDNTRFIRASIAEVEETIYVAFLLVVLIIFLFLRDWRVTLVCAALFLGAVIITRYVSLGSILVVISFFIQILVYGAHGTFTVSADHLMEFYAVAFVLMAMAIWRHKTNIKRLLSGTENKLWGGKKN